MDERPPPSPEKLLRQFRDWRDDTELPGRTMSYMKTGFLPEVLEALPDTPQITRIRDAWDEWEAGTTSPSAVLEALADAGLEALLTTLAGSTSEE